MTCVPVDRCHFFGEKFYLLLQDFSLKMEEVCSFATFYLPTSPHCFATQKTNIDVFTTVRTEIVRYVTYEAVDWTKLASYMG
jgi:hypothetical protein